MLFRSGFPLAQLLLWGDTDEAQVDLKWKLQEVSLNHAEKKEEEQGFLPLYLMTLHCNKAGGWGR